jgi:hypothetical protein
MKKDPSPLYLTIRPCFIFSSNMKAPPIRYFLSTKERISDSLMPTFRNPLSPPKEHGARSGKSEVKDFIVTLC